jgi:hypothetical protein
MDTVELSKVWQDLKQDAGAAGHSSELLFRTLGRSAQGVRAAYAPQDQQLQLLIEVPDKWA